MWQGVSTQPASDIGLLSGGSYSLPSSSNQMQNGFERLSKPSAREVTRGVVPNVVDTTKSQTQGSWQARDPLDDIMAGYLADLSVSKQRKQ